MKNYFLCACLFFSTYVYGDSTVEKNIFKVRSAYLADHISSLSYQPEKWKMGKLKVLSEKYHPKSGERVIEYAFQAGEKVFSDRIRVGQDIAQISPDEWMRNPMYTKGYAGFVGGVIEDGKLITRSVCILPDKTITSKDLSKIQRHPKGFATLSENLNACIAKDYGDSMVGWLGIRREPDISGAVIFSLLSRTKQDYRASAMAILVGPGSHIKQEEIKSLIKLVFFESALNLAEDVATGVMATSYCSPWQANRLCDIAKGLIFQELQRSDQKGEVLNFIKTHLDKR